MGKIKVIIKRPGKRPYVAHISNTLESLQKTVGGYIETVTLTKDIVIICNEEGAINDMPFNCNICGIQFFGPIIFAGVCEDEFSNIPCDLDDFNRLLGELIMKGINK